MTRAGWPSSRTHGSWTALLLAWCVRAYQILLAPWLGARCRFHPSCSNYALDALAEHGAVRGSWLTARRLVRCQPFSVGGIDPVPPVSERL